MKYLLVDEEVELAKSEPSIKEKDLLVEILPLMQDYFVGEIALDRQAIVYRLPNGQTFRITTHQV